MLLGMSSTKQAIYRGNKHLTMQSIQQIQGDKTKTKHHALSHNL